MSCPPTLNEPPLMFISEVPWFSLHVAFAAVSTEPLIKLNTPLHPEWLPWPTINVLLFCLYVPPLTVIVPVLLYPP